jgi:hypothetical protein
MTPGQTLLSRLGALLSADATTLASATLAVKVHLAQAAFTPGLGLTPASFTEATFVGYAPILGATGPQQNFIDPLTGYQTIQLGEPLGGWHWIVGTAVGLPQTIYGWWVADNGNANVYGSGLFPTPFILSAPGQGIDIPILRWQIPPTALQ